MGTGIPEEQQGRRLYILLTDTGTLFTRLIKAYTGAPCNHASLALDPSLRHMYSFGRKDQSHPLAAGFVREEAAGMCLEYPRTACVLLRLEATEEQFRRACGVIRYFEQTVDRYGYNLLGLLGFVLNLRFEPQDRYFCSQFVADALERSGIALFDQPPALTAPHHFLEHPELQVVYEGLLSDYPLLDRDGRRAGSAEGESLPLRLPKRAAV
ncbi:hypothetical protein ACTHPH_16085 [Paenibacillus pasadenensis]|uniref:hypothetical protein n=1 Tax=Paenibacillus pasadenensis TaxID=217090 RepID=UPI0004190DC8|nr:hypothetical protein [Paenibacillus pasadenensis]